MGRQIDGPKGQAPGLGWRKAATLAGVRRLDTVTMGTHSLSWEEGALGPKGRPGEGPRCFSSLGRERAQSPGALQTRAVLSAASSWQAQSTERV